MLRALLLTLTIQALAAAQPSAQADCRYHDIPARHDAYDDWQRTLLDTMFALGEAYVPPDLTDVDDQGHQLRALLLEDLEALLAAASKAGNPLAIQSAYRSHGYQASTFAYWVERDGYQVALRTSARAGHSEHQLGTATDFRSADGPPAWELEDWATTPAGAWLASNGWRFGFVMSYPQGQEANTCYDYEPWHYRYLGREAAGEIHRRGLTLRGWLLERQ